MRNDPRARQTGFNHLSFPQWEGFAEHRQRVSTLLAEPPGRLCVLGAGNANDLDLASLLQFHREVHLVDLDADALARGTHRQEVADRPTLFRHGNLDVTGMLDAIARWSPTGTIAEVELEALVDWPVRRVSLALPGPFDLVASTCLLSQLIANAHHAIGEAHPQFSQVIQAIRLGHLRLLASLARPGARVVLITDIASTDWAPEIARVPEDDLPSLIPRLLAHQGLIRGVIPVELVTILRRDPVLQANLDQIRLVSPWRWRLHDRTYLVSAIEARVKPVLA